MGQYPEDVPSFNGFHILENFPLTIISKFYACRRAWGYVELEILRLYIARLVD
jgi:hypothetical protein